MRKKEDERIFFLCGITKFENLKTYFVLILRFVYLGGK